MKVIACATVIEELLPLLPPETAYEVLDFGLHLTPNTLRDTLQAAIDRTAPGIDTVVLGYGLCSMAVVGLKATTVTLVVPKVDDCIAIFLGSDKAYTNQFTKEPGTYYLTKGWIEVNDTPFEEFKRLVERYGQERAHKVLQAMLKNYTRVAYIDTGHRDKERDLEYARNMAQKFGLRFEEIPGSKTLIEQMVFGPWDERFVVVGPGETITLAHFKSNLTETGKLSAE